MQMVEGLFTSARGALERVRRKDPRRPSDSEMVGAPCGMHPQPVTGRGGRPHTVGMVARKQV